MTKEKLLAAILMVTGTIGFGFWRWKVGGNTHPGHSIVDWDRSESSATDCDCVVASAKRALESPQLRKGSTLMVIATGDESSAGEPTVVSSYEVPVNRRVLEGRGAIGDRRDELLADLKVKCEKLDRTKTSSIYLSIKRAIEHLRAAGCNGESHCVVQVETDLEENVNLQIKRALDAHVSAEQSLPPSINNDGIDIVISGIAQTVGLAKGGNGAIRRFTSNRDERRADQIVEVWRKLFTSPNRVTFQPYCPSIETASYK